MQRILTELDRSHEVKQGHQEVRGFSVAFTARERLQPSLRTALFAGNPVMHAQVLANIRAMGERIRSIGQDASMPVLSVFSEGQANDC
jgi:hypothetical protein